MTKKTKISILIITIYFVTFFLFEFFIGTARAIESVEKSIELGMASILTPMVTFVEAGIWHFICVLIVTMVCKYMKNIDKSYKHIVYSFPIITFIFSIPMGFLTTYLANILNCFGL